IIGWDLILEYAVGNVAVAISWGDYFKSFLGAFGVHLPDFLTTGYRTALLSADPATHGLLDTAPHVAGIPILINVPAFVIVGAVLTGIVKYSDLGVADPLAKALDVAGYKTVGWIVSLGAIVSMSAVLLVFQYGQPRIFFAMARDGLLPPWAAKISANRRVPY